MLGLGGMLAGLTFEESGESDEALRWYDQTLQFTGFRLRPCWWLMQRGNYRSPRLKDIEATGPAEPRPLAAAGKGRLSSSSATAACRTRSPSAFPSALR